MVEEAGQKRFDEVAMPHLDAAYNLARWLTRNDADARDVVQEAYLRAFRFFGGYRGGDARAWVLQIVRRTCFTWMAANRAIETVASEAEIGDDAGMVETALLRDGRQPDPETLLLQRLDTQLLDRLIEGLPPLYREIIVLREIEELSYREIAEILELPIGTVMSRLARARRRLHQAWRASPDARLEG